MNLDKFNKHMANPHKFKIAEDEFEIMPLGVEYIGELLDLASTKNPTKNDRDRLVKLIKISLKETYPELSDEQLNKFIVGNYLILANVIFDANPLGTDKIDVIKERIEAIKNATKNNASDKKEEGG